MSRRYGRAQFIRDAASLGLTREAAFSRAELRRRRDSLIIVHHPDRGGDAGKAARINTVYTRMTSWLDARNARAAEAGTGAERRAGDSPEPTSAGLGRGAAQVCGLALAAAAAYAAFRIKRTP